MTDIEQKAEEYRQKNIGRKMNETQIVKQQLERNKEYSVIEVIEQLEKENAELKGENTVLTEELEKYERDFESDELALNEANEIIAELKAQIEKMKCCGNCRYFTGEKCTYAYRDVNHYDDCETWDLAG